MASVSIDQDCLFMRRALQLARRGYGRVSPNPMVGAILVSKDRVVGQGWHARAGDRHAEVVAIQDALSLGHATRGATLYVTLEPCSTTGQTPPCTQAILEAGIHRVVVACKDPNPRHMGRGISLLKRAGLQVTTGALQVQAKELNQSFFYWICHRRPWVTVKAAMTLDGKIATASGESKWITGPEARKHAMRMRYGMDAILVGIETVLADDPGLTVRPDNAAVSAKPLLRIILDSGARTPLNAQVVSDASRDWTRVVVAQGAPRKRVKALQSIVEVWESPTQGRVDLSWLMDRLGKDGVTALLVEGGGTVNGAFFEQSLAHAVAFYYAPKILGGAEARKAVGGGGAALLSDTTRLLRVRWKKVGQDLVMQAHVQRNQDGS
ncbi:MAG: bifunctional diaminohydroxyphosphoribosylaminopyrimidine deaminase/5-amino-6-(5-phosphoribosylamino)uracil reductase RibD [Verrucomicrobiota bacterium]|jgi:diaminohydroxyphosphoribosylaminopyrimidine deaminase / 5-amino-6-(5-phosphoribosylamino)uracil reductase|nr:bifunctional diaminohydroxyphosphoribosylaminopyrimidine deaminase/5-amino-6-(5-phosphoribosylamino)uracil reductase RibD [Verrucomicrobiota bacterium]